MNLKKEKGRRVTPSISKKNYSCGLRDSDHLAVPLLKTGCSDSRASGFAVCELHSSALLWMESFLPQPSLLHLLPEGIVFGLAGNI